MNVVAGYGHSAGEASWLMKGCYVVRRPSGHFINLTEILESMAGNTVTDINTRDNEHPNGPLNREPTVEETHQESECEIIEVTRKVIPLIELGDDSPGPQLVNLEDSDETITLENSNETVNIPSSQETLPIENSEEYVLLSSSQEPISTNCTKELIAVTGKEGAAETTDVHEPAEPPLDTLSHESHPSSVSDVNEPGSPIGTNAVLETALAEEAADAEKENVELELAIPASREEGKLIGSVTCVTAHPSEANAATEAPAGDAPSPPEVAGVEENEQKNCLRKLRNESCHQMHSTKTDQRRVLCVDCNVRICPICHFNFNGHLKQHMSGGKSMELCETCGASFSTRCALKAHTKLHQVDAPFVCPDCGSTYQQLRFFLQHSLERCYHLFNHPEYCCQKCSRMFTSTDHFRKHQRTHMMFHFRCRVCCKDVGVSRQKAAAHVKANHQMKVSAEALSVCLDVNLMCEYCDEVVTRDHWKIHKPVPYKTQLNCPCGVKLSSVVLFRRHRNSCDQSRVVPEFWAKTFNISKAAEDKKRFIPPWCRRDGTFRECKNCDSNYFESGSGDFCPKCVSSDASESTECEVNRRDADQNGCSTVAENQPPRERVCSECDELFMPKGGPHKCDACRGVPIPLSDWLGGEQVVGTELDVDEPCDVEYPGQPTEHSYCVRHALLWEVNIEMKLQREEYGFSFMKTPERDLFPEGSNPLPMPRLSRNSKIKANPFKCCVCGFLLPGGSASIYDLLTHMKTFHQNAVLPIRMKRGLFCKKEHEVHEDEDTDLMTRLKKLVVQSKSNDGNKNALAGGGRPNIMSKKDTDNGSQDEKTVTQRKRMRLYVPKKTEDCSKKYLSASTENSCISKLETSKDSTEEIVPQKKEHEFWDGFYEALSAVEGRNLPKTKKEVLDNIPSYGNKRQVKKPKRFVEEQDEDSQSSCKKASSGSESPGKQSPEKKIALKMKEVSKKSVEFQKEVEVMSDKKYKKRNLLQIDEDLEAVKRKLKKDDEIGFIAKTFDTEGTSQAPNKRRRKLASKLVYLKKLNEEELTSVQEVAAEIQDLTCVVCKALFVDKEDFRSHIVTHRTDDNTFQCMECGECFIVRPSLEKHLHAFHKIKEIRRYIEENRCNLKLESTEQNGQLSHNQCKVCREVFPSTLDLTKHFRIHGMAFLMEAQKDAKIN